MIETTNAIANSSFLNNSTMKSQDAAPLCMARHIASQSTAEQPLDAVDAPKLTHPFDATLILQVLRDKRSRKKHQRYRKSRLQRWRAEMVALFEAGGSFREITDWLKDQKKVNMDHTSVMRFLKSLPEIKSNMQQANTEEEI